MIQTNVTPSLKRCLITYGAKRCSSHSHCCSSSSSISRNSQGPKLFEYRRRLPALALAVSKPRSHSRSQSHSQSHEYINRRFFSKDAVSTTPSEMGIPVPAEGKIKSISNEHISNNDLNLAIQAANEDLGQELSDSDSNLDSDSDPASVPLNIENIPGTSKGGSRKLAIIFTCNVCETRSAKRFTEQAYNHGVVLVRCPKCESLHLIADRLGYFSDNNDNGNGNGGKGWDIETFMASIGQEDNVRVAAEGKEVLEVTLKDVLGDKMPMPTRSSTSSEDSSKK